MNNKVKHIILFFALLVIILLLYSCGDKSYRVEDLRLEERHNFTLPEGGEVIYHNSVTAGFDFRDYVVVAYNDVDSLKGLPWRELKDQEVYRFKEVVADINERLAAEYKEYIPAELIPNYSNVQGIILKDTIKTMLLFDEQKGMIYICIVKM